MISVKAVDVVGLDAARGFDVAAHGVGPGLGAEDARAQRQFAQVDAHLRGAVEQVQEVDWGAADGRDAEILHDHDLPVGVAAGNGDDRGAQRLGAVVRAQAAGEQAVAVGVLHDVAAVQAAGRERARP